MTAPVSYTHLDVYKRQSSGYARIIRVYDNTPATNVGLEVGGFITAIGDTSTRSMSDTATMTLSLIHIWIFTPKRGSCTLLRMCSAWFC